MIYLLSAISCSAMISLIMRFSERKVRHNIAMLAVNYLACSVVAACFMGGQGMTLPGWNTVLLGCVGGVLFLLSFALLQRNLQINGVVLSSVFMRLGVLISIGVSIVLFGEKPGVFQIVGILLALVAIVLAGGKGEASAVSRLGLAVLLLFGGLADAMSKFFEEWGNPREEGWYLLLIFFVALLLCMGLMAHKKQRIGKWELLFGICVGAPNYFSTLLFLKSLEKVPAVVAYPVYSVGTILTITLAGVFLFRERLTRGQWVAMGFIVAALTFLNLS